MAHRLLTPPGGRLTGPVRLPMVQHPGEQIASNLINSMRIRDALRRVKTSQTQIATGPLHSPQVFAISRASGTNDPNANTDSLRPMNARRLVGKTRGQAAGG